MLEITSNRGNLMIDPELHVWHGEIAAYLFLIDPCLEQLFGSQRGQFSIRINDRYRLCFHWTETGPADVEIVDYH